MKILSKILIFILFISPFLQSCKEENKDTPNPSTTTRVTGFTPATPAQLAGVNEVPKLSLGASPGIYYLLEAPPVGNQGQTFSCTSWATAYAGMSYLINKSKNISYSYNNNSLFNPHYVYNQLSGGACLLTGTTFPENFNILKNQGVCTFSDMPLNGADCGSRPNSNQIAAASKYKIAKWEQVNQNDIDNIKTILTTNKPVFISIWADEVFNNLKYPFILNAVGSEKKYGHALTVIGFEDIRKSFIVQNSWGEEWGDSGRFYITYDIFPKAVLEAYYMELAISKPTDNVTNGLVLHLPFDGNGNDLSGNNNNAKSTTTNPRFVTDRFGNPSKAAEFGQLTADYYNVANSNSLNFTNSFTFSCWVNIKGKEGGHFAYENDKLIAYKNELFGKGTTNNYISAELENYYDKLSKKELPDLSFGFLYAYPGATFKGIGNWINSTKPDLGKWVHLVFSYSNNTVKIYKNGTLLFKTPHTFNISAGNNQPLRIGAKFNGKIDDFRMYNRELSESEVQKLYLQ